MENEKQTPMELNQEEQPVETQANAPASEVQPQSEPQPKKKGWKYLVFLLLIMAFGAVAYLGYTNPQLFKAEITEVTYTGLDYLAIPEYNAGSGDTGNIAIKVYNLPTPESIYSMQFRLNYSPVDALEFNENSIVFDDFTLFKSADLKSVNTSTPGEIFVTFFSSTAVSIGGDDVDVVKLAVEVTGTPGSTIDLSVEDVELIKEDAGFVVSTQFSEIAADQINVTTQNDLRVLNAEAIAANKVLVRFSDYLQNTGGPGDYGFLPGPFAAFVVESGTDYGYDQKTVVLTTTVQTPPGTEYTLEILGGVQGNVEGGIADDYRKAVFQGYKDPSDPGNSSVELQSIDINSSTEVELNFSAALDASTVTVINIDIQSLLPAASLTVSDVEMVDTNTVRLTTAQQSPDVNYFVSFDGVEDQGGLPLVNNRLLNFFGFTVPPITISNISPSTVTNNVEQLVTVVGQNLDGVETARLDTTLAEIRNQTAGALDIVVPIGFTTGIYDVTLVSATGVPQTFTDALVVSAPEQPMRIISEESRAIPNRVPPDGETEVNFWVLVEDPVNLANIDSVTIDLEQIGGNRAQEMVKDTGQQPQYQQFYTYTTTVTPTTPTSDTPYRLDVQVRKGAEVANGTVEIVVTRDVLGSVAPTIVQVYANPATVAPDGITEVTISAKISDPDGANTITAVVADLGPLGAGFILLNSLDIAGTANENIIGWYASDSFTLPATTPEGDYTVTITADDETGESSTSTFDLSVSTELTGPSIDGDRTYISPRKSVPKDGKTPFSLHTMVSDPNDVSDIDTVTAYFDDVLGIAPVSLLRDPSASETAKTALYSSSDITIPTTASTGIREIEIVATDKSGGIGNAILQLDVTHKDTLGDPPFIFSNKSYTTPKVAINDGQTRITLYTFVRDDDDDLEAVVVNLGEIGQVGPEPTPDFAQVGAAPAAAPSGDGGGTCPTGSNVFVCMQPSFKEGSEGQWFILSDVTVSSTTFASSEPYMVEVIATDATGKVSRGTIPVSVNDGGDFTADKNPPEIAAAVATSPETVEVVFNEEIAAKSISPSGAEFTITDKDDISKKLNISGATINATGTIVTLTTAPQETKKEYVLTGSNKITDSVGVALVAGAYNRVFLNGFEDSTKPPSVEYIASTSPNTIEIEFMDYLRPSSVKLLPVTDEQARLEPELRGGRDLNIEIYESATSVPLEVYGVQFIEAANILEIITATQKSGQSYRLRIQGLASAAGVEGKVSINKLVKGFNMSKVQTQVVGNQADLNGDGKVDFIDFTMFSAVYGQALGAMDSGSTGTSLSPISPEPDSTVPHTTTPSGGQIPASSSIPPQ